jgi:hypothetical protein
MTSSNLDRPLKLLASELRRLWRCTSGVAITEFAFVAPVFLTLGVLGLDTASYISTHMRVSQIAIHVADNASRVGEHGVLVARKIRESDINDLLIGAERYAGSLNLGENGRVIISSLEQNALLWREGMGIDLRHGG